MIREFVVNHGSHAADTVKGEILEKPCLLTF